MQDSRLVAKIAVSQISLSADKLYTYLVPAEYADIVSIGQRVIVPFGRGNKKIQGFVIELSATGSGEYDKLKEIVYIYDDIAQLSAEDIEIAFFLKNRCFCSFFDCANALMPPGVWSDRSEVYYPGNIQEDEALLRVRNSVKKVDLLQQIFRADHKLSCAELIKLTGIQTARTHLKQMLDMQIIQSEQCFNKSTADKYILTASMAMTLNEAEALIPAGKLGQRRIEVLRCLSQAFSMPEKELCYLTGVSSALIRGLEKSGFIKLEKVEVYRRPEIKSIDKAPVIELNQSQTEAYDKISSLLDNKPRGALLYGVTGSGKTEIYIKLIQDVLKTGKTAVLLVPEIALTPQTVRRFCLYFKDDIAIIHSALTATQRYDEYKRIRSGKAHIVVGTRSAIFAPLSDIGIIIVDEEQEHTYRSENSPRYNAIDVAKFRAAKHNCLVLLGSATPSVETMYSAQSGKVELVKLSKRFNDMPLPYTIVSDMRGSIKLGNISCIGKELSEEISTNIANGEKTILFLNRRGAANRLICVDCGYIPSCKNCSVSLVYHSKSRRLMCHHCGYSEQAPEICTECGSNHIKYQGIGTQKVEDELKELFSDIKIIRMDADTIIGRASHEQLLDEFSSSDANILLGTQMVAKGLDFDSVTLVGVIDCDSFMYSEDYRAQERAFSLIAQVIGRAGRHSRPGRAVIQTYCPDNPVIRSAAVQDYDAFYNYEISVRQALKVPPFDDIFVFTLSGESQTLVTQAALSLVATLRQSFDSSDKEIGRQVLGPVTPSIEKLNNKYRLSVSFRGINNNSTRIFVERIITAFAKTPYSKKVTIAADVNPYN